MRIWKALGALLIMLVLVVGVPAALVAWGDLSAWLTTDWARALTAPVAGGLVIALVSALAWLCWALLVVSVLAEVVALATRRRVSLPGLAWLQPVVATLLAAIVAGLAASAQGRSTHEVSAAPPASVTAVRPSMVMAEPGSSPTITEPTRSHVVSEGDELWSIAESYYGDGRQWTTIAQANGINETTTLRVGSQLALPGLPPVGPLHVPPIPEHPVPEQPIQEQPVQVQPVQVQPAQAQPAQVGAPQAPRAGVNRVTVRAGDSLWAIAERELGDPHRWPEVAALNRQLIDNPDEIEIGWVLTLPKAAASTGPANPRPANSRPASSRPRVQGPGVQNPGTTAVGDLSRPERLTPPSSSAPTNPAPTQQAPTNPAPSQPAPTHPDPSNPAPTTPDPTSAPSTPVAQSSEQQMVTADPVARVAGSLTALMAAGVSVGLLMRRRQQLAQRHPGRRLLAAERESHRLAALWHKRAAEAEPPLDPSPVLVVVGERDHEAVTLDLTGRTVITVAGADPELTTDLLGGMVTSLASAEWSQTTEVLAVGAGLGWAGQLDHPLVRCLSLPGAIERLRERCSAVAALDSVADDQPWVVVVAEPPTPEQQRQLVDLAERTPGVHLVLAAGSSEASAPTLIVDSSTSARWADQLLDEAPFWPALVGEPVRRALIDLHRITTTTDTGPAPWWADDPPGQPPTIHNPPIIADSDAAELDREEEDMAHQQTRISEPTPFDDADHPVLLVLGPVRLVATRGEAPNRAIKQCEEYCGWLLENPGRTSQIMASSLMVAEPTRRSNMSRLRTWLGESTTGDQYLPEAYHGRISLHPAVSSDWEQLQSMVALGVNRTPSQVLVEALELVRGEPFADVAPGQWTWAELWRSDMISVIRDVAFVLATRSLEAGDLVTSRWAVNRGLRCSGDDELLLATRIKVEYAEGNHAEVDRYVMQLTRSARAQGVDLRDDTVVLLQEVMEGRARRRRV